MLEPGNFRDIVLNLQGDPNDLTTFYGEKNSGSLALQSINLEGNTLTVIIEALIDFPVGFYFFIDYGFATSTNSAANANGSVKIRCIEFLPSGIGSASIGSTFTVQ